ncbi:MAG: iron-containing alcohol dehydrogenase [Negativicutes bacterium]|nr:iron-containing alcohol dehydrogenase [Negativicutes bacterium]
MWQFDFTNPVRLVFGRGKLAVVGEEAKRCGRKALIVTSGSSGRTGLLAKVVDLIKQAGVECVVFDQVKANPLTTMAHAGAALAKTERCDVVVGLGGGSAMDAAKAIAFMAVNDGDVSEYIYGKPGSGALPVILITTTAGTGSEGNNVAVLTNPENNDKKGLKSPFLYAKASIIDPELLLTLPQRAIAGPGLDAMFHAIEAYVARRSNPITAMMALQAISWLTESLPAVYHDSSNIEAWERVSLANTLAGMAIDASGTTLAHGLEHPVSGLFDVAHGEGLAALIVPFMEFSYSAAPEKFAMIAKIMGEEVAGLSDEQAAAKSAPAMARLLKTLGMELRLRDFGVTSANLDWLTANALKTMKANIDNSPKVPGEAEIKEIYSKSL